MPLLRLSEFEDVSKPPKPVPASGIARVIGALLNMFQATDERDYLDKARLLAHYAMAHYYRDGLFVCGPPWHPRYGAKKLDVWRTYSNRGGSGQLALVLLRLHLVLGGREDFLDDFPWTN